MYQTNFEEMLLEWFSAKDYVFVLIENPLCLPSLEPCPEKSLKTGETQ